MLSRVSQYLPSFSMPSAQKMAQGAIVAATAAVALHAISNIPSADAGPITYWSCVVGCELMLPPFIAACVAACLPLIAAPCP